MMPVPPFALGDVIFTCDNSTLLRKVISAAQSIGTRNANGADNPVHAAVVIGIGGAAPTVAEAVGSGIRHQALQPGNYRVFRAVDQNLAAHAAMCAEGCLAIKQVNGQDDYGEYATGRAILSPFRLTQGGQKATQSTSLFAREVTSFFCSNFVYKVYASAAELAGLAAVPITGGRSQIGPRDLMIAMDGDAANWTNEGRHHQ